MKLLLASVNAKYIHTNLAIRYLSKVIEGICHTNIKEYTINDNNMSVQRDILLSNPDIIAFSCYIWNIEYVLNLCSDIKKALPGVIIILGGPEVSYNSCEIMDKHTFIDYIIKGEGEITFPKLLNHIVNKFPVPCEGITYRTNSDIVDTPHLAGPDFTQIPFPYDKNTLLELDGRIIYYESSRGCPYSCKYCLSGDRGKVRFKDIKKVKEELKFFSDNNVNLVKFVDRTFNADRKRACEIWQYISSLNTHTRFHMEITGELLDDDTIEVLKKVNPDNLQFEIGVQSTNPSTLDAIGRKCSLDKLFYNISRLLNETNIHIHLDLIAGLPYEDLSCFKKSFNDVVSLRPHVLQLGFLKLLRGTDMRRDCDRYGIIYREKAPYEIISNKFMSSLEILFLKDIDFVFDKYYNSGSFNKTMKFLFSKYPDKFQIFEDLVNYFRQNNYINTSLSKAKLYDILYNCFSHFGTSFEEALRYDYIYSLHSGKLPSWCNSDNSINFSQPVFEFLKNEELKKDIIPYFANTSAKSIIKHVRFEKFSYGILMFDYINNKVYDVTKYIKLEKNK